MESSPTRPVANRPLGARSSSSTIESRQQTAYQQSMSELPSSNGSQNHHHARGETSTSQQQQAPFFERVGVKGDVKVVQNYSRIVKQQNTRLREMEKIHKDLEERLELETKEKETLVATLAQREREWELLLAQAEAKQEHLKLKMNEEIEKNKVFSEKLSRKDQDIHRMMQRKYDPGKKSLSGSSRHPPIERERAHTLSASSSPADARHLEPKGGPLDFMFMKDPPDAMREKSVAFLLEDLFGMNN